MKEEFQESYQEVIIIVYSTKSKPKKTKVRVWRLGARRLLTFPPPPCAHEH